jgi:hypothetical protein
MASITLLEIAQRVDAGRIMVDGSTEKLLDSPCQSSESKKVLVPRYRAQGRQSA